MAADEESPIYLDFNATTPIHPKVAESMRDFLMADNTWGNPSSSHAFGRVAKRELELARGRVAELLGAAKSEITFTSGGTEANNTALLSFLGRKRMHVVVSAIEHPSIREVCSRRFANENLSVVPVNAQGIVSPAAVAALVTKHTAVVSIMHANNETGVIQPIRAIVDEVKKANPETLVHTDAAQSIGKVLVRVRDLGVDLLSVCAHKFYGPKGVGALFMKQGIKINPLLLGGDQESGFRAGTENVLEIVGLGKASELARQELGDRALRMRRTRDLLWSLINERLGPSYADQLSINGPSNDPSSPKLPNTLNMSFRGVQADTLIASIQDKVAFSAGAACHTEHVEMSPVLKAMGVPTILAMGTVRLSTGISTSVEEIERAAKIISAAVRPLLSKSGAPAVDEDIAIPAPEDVRLTQYTHGLGCACKLRPQALERVLASLPRGRRDPRVLVGFDNSDDASVYQITDDIAIVSTVDFFTPVCDDPRLFGAIAAANALSDIYAMGATPLTALSIVGFPTNRLPEATLQQILSGATVKCGEADIAITGGHTIEDIEPKYGLAVTGIIDPRFISRNRGVHPGCWFVLTKPLGTGIVSTAAKRGVADESVKNKAFNTMAELNKCAAGAFFAEGADRPVACTDVTGFGLSGHLLEMIKDSDVDAVLYADALPVLEGAAELVIDYGSTAIPGGTLNNVEYAGDRLVVCEGVLPDGLRVTSSPPLSSRDTAVVRTLVCDAQTSGGLLGAFGSLEAARRANGDLTRLAGDRAAAQQSAVVGKTVPGKGRIIIMTEPNSS